LDICTLLTLGVGHSDDLGYIFPMAPSVVFPKMVVTPAQQKTRQNLLDLLETFALSGRPTREEEVWLQESGSSVKHCDVGESLRAARDPGIASQLLFWRGVRAAARDAAPPIASHPPAVFHTKKAFERTI
jgi:hypothetical protein